MVGTDDGPKKIFRVVEHIQLEYIQKQGHGYVLLLVIVNVSIDSLIANL